METGFGDAASLASSSLASSFLTPLAPSQESDAGSRPIESRRVLHVINGEHYSGAERVQDLLAARLPEFGYEVGFACVKHKRFSEARQYRQARIHEIDMRARFDFRAVVQLCEVIDRYGYQLIHAHTPRSVMIGKLAATRCSLPLVYHAHSPTSRDSTRSTLNRINAMAEKLSLIGAARLITVSESLHGHMRAMGYRREQLTVVPNGVPCVIPVPEHPEPTDPWVLGTIALFRPRKGTEVLLDAIAILRQRGLDVRLRAVGGFETEEYEQTLRQRASELKVEDLIEWTGFQRDVNSQLQQMDLFVLPSLFGEGLPMVVLEAMAMGIPVVGTDVEGVPEAIRNGVEGRVARPGDPLDLAKSIGSIIGGDDSWREMRAAAIQRQNDHFSDRTMAKRVAAVYDEILPAIHKEGPSATAHQTLAGE